MRSCGPCTVVSAILWEMDSLLIALWGTPLGVRCQIFKTTTSDASKRNVIGKSSCVCVCVCAYHYLPL